MTEGRMSRFIPAIIIIFACLLLNCPIEKVCATSKRACVRKRASCTTWASRAGCRAVLWPMPTRAATGASTPTLPSRSSPLPVVFMPQNRLASISTTRSTLWMPAPSTCVCRSFLGLRFARPRRLSSCTRSWTCVATSLRSSSDGKLHDVNVLDLLLPEPGAFYIMDRGYIDFERLYQLHEAKSFFVTRAKSNLKAQRRYSHPVDRSTGLICDQTIVLSGFYSRQDFDTPLRRVRFKDPTTGKRLVFLTNNFILPAFTITELYRCRWQVELFFKWIKQHLRIKVFFGTSENAVKTQIWIAVSVYVLVAIVKKRLNLSASLYEMLQILSLTMFERIPLDQLLTKIVTDDIHAFSPNQLNLFN